MKFVLLGGCSTQFWSRGETNSKLVPLLELSESETFQPVYRTNGPTHSGSAVYYLHWNKTQFLRPVNVWNGPEQRITSLFCHAKRT